MITLHIDGAARGNPGPSGYGICAYDENGELIQKAHGFLGNQTNNVAEYVALLAALQLSLNNDWLEVTVKSDSQLMVKQISGEYRVKNEVLAGFYRRAKVLIGRFDKVRVEHVRREFNKCADAMANVSVDQQDSDPAEINPLNA